MIRIVEMVSDFPEDLILRPGMRSIQAIYSLLGWGTSQDELKWLM
jgi:hypothetical protein